LAAGAGPPANNIATLLIAVIDERFKL